MNYQKRMTSNFTKMKMQDEKFKLMKEDVTYNKIVDISFIILSISVIQFLIRAFIGHFSIMIDIPLLLLTVFSFFTFAIYIASMDKRRVNRLEDYLKNDKEILKFLNSFVIYDNQKVKPVHHFLRPELSSNTTLIYEFPENYTIVDNQYEKNPKYDYRIKENAIVLYGRKHFKPVSKRKIIKKVTSFIKVEKEYQTFKRNNKEDEFYAKIKERNSIE